MWQISFTLATLLGSTCLSFHVPHARHFHESSILQYVISPKASLLYNDLDITLDEKAELKFLRKGHTLLPNLINKNFLSETLGPALKEIYEQS